jgi:hypothetical protein
MEYPNSHRAMNAAIRQTGTVTAGIKDARTLPRNSQITSNTRAMASNRVLYTFFTAASMNTVVSKLMPMLMPSGRPGLMRSISARTSLETCSELAVEVLTMPSASWGSPLPRNQDRRSADSRATRATSDNSTVWPSGSVFSTIFSNACGESKLRLTRSRKSRSFDSSRPAGNSRFSRRRAFSTSATVNDRAANASSFSQMRMA